MDIALSGHDHATEPIDIYYDGVCFPFDDNCIDSVICTQVLEHVTTPEVTLSEIYRVLKPMGYALLTVPFLSEEHEQPFDYYRYSSFGMHFLLENQNFEIIKTCKLNRNIALVFACLWNTYWYKLYKTRYPVISLLLTPIVHAPVTLLGYLLCLILPRTKDFYTDLLLLVRKK
jgi:SAM-dependent methyltransferase